MKFILIQLCLLDFAAAVRFDFKHQNCTVYKQKLGVANNPGGTGSIKMVFYRRCQYLRRYCENDDLLDDPIYFGLVQEGGKTAETTCLNLKLWQFTSNTYSNPVQITDLPIRSDFNYYLNWRFYYFTIPTQHQGEDQYKLLIVNNLFAFYAAGTDEVIFTFYFEISLIIYKLYRSATYSAFKSLSQSSTAHCTLKASCNEKADTFFKLMHRFDMHIIQNPRFTFKIVTTPGIDYYLTETEVWYTGYGLIEKAFLVKIINNSIKRQVIIQLQPEIVWSAEVTIRVTSKLSTTQADDRSQVYGIVNGETKEFTCIKAEREETCPTSEQEYWTNGFCINERKNITGILVLLNQQCQISFLLLL